MSEPPERRVPRTDAESALAALIRARKRAEEIAAATGTAIVHWEDGKLVYLYPGRKSESVDPPDPPPDEPSKPVGPAD